MSVTTPEGTGVREAVDARWFKHCSTQFTLFTNDIRAQCATLVTRFLTLVRNLERKAEIAYLAADNEQMNHKTESNLVRKLALCFI
jgi:hypothetical protein